MGKTKDLFKKISFTKGTFHAKMGTIKDRNGMDPTEAEDIKKRCQKYTSLVYKSTPLVPKGIKILRRGAKSTPLWCTKVHFWCQKYTSIKKNYTKEIFIIQITTIV